MSSESSGLGKANRLVGYVAAFVVSSLFYVGWFTVASRVPGSDVTILFQIGIAIFFWAFGGVAAALIAMSLPWSLVVIGTSRIRQFGLPSSLALGAALTILFGCASSSLAPKPLFIEDQTFLEGFVIAFQRQGVCFLLAGLLFGATYWYLSERGRRSRSV
jgi:hypothetical protein